jgi:hypothetical protein
MSVPVLIDDDLLRDLERRWVDLGTSTLERMSPGLTDAQIDEIAAPLGFPLPEEVRTLYRWRDGSGLSTFIWGRGMYSLEQAVADTEDFRRQDDDWSATWLCILDERPYVAIECGGGLTGPTFVWHYGADWGMPTRPVFDSLGDMVSFWIELIDAGQVLYDPAAGWNEIESVPPEVGLRIRDVPID